MATRQRKRKSDYGSVYRGHEGQWSWLFHRVTGVAVILFLFAHIVDTAVIGWGPEAYDRVASVYHNPIVRLLELGLVEAVIFHALNGVRILVIDFVPRATRVDRQLFWATTAIFAASSIPIAYIMIKGAVELL